MSGVKIKPLVWVKTGKASHMAMTSIAFFEVWESIVDDECKALCQGQQPYGFQSIEEAKAACEAEYERRVRECLE